MMFVNVVMSWYMTYVIYIVGKGNSLRAHVVMKLRRAYTTYIRLMYFKNPYNYDTLTILLCRFGNYLLRGARYGLSSWRLRRLLTIRGQIMYVYYVCFVIFVVLTFPEDSRIITFYKTNHYENTKMKST